MTITLNADYDVTLNTALLGYVGETNARPVSVEGLTAYLMTTLQRLKRLPKTRLR